MASEELRELLRSIRPVYEQYAEKLHTAGYWGIVELAAAKPEALREVAEVPIPQASAIVAAAQAQSIAAAAPAAAVTVHICQGSKKLPSMEVPIQQGKVNLAPVLITYPLTIEKIAVSDSALSRPSYEPMESLNVPAQPGQHMYIMAKSTEPGSTVGMWLVRMLLSTAWHWMVAKMPGPTPTALWRAFDLVALNYCMPRFQADCSHPDNRVPAPVHALCVWLRGWRCLAAMSLWITHGLSSTRWLATTHFQPGWPGLCRRQAKSFGAAPGPAGQKGMKKCKQQQAAALAQLHVLHGWKPW